MSDQKQTTAINLHQYAKSVHSQQGEDGITHAILEKIGLNKKPGIFFEFGAWDGIHLSNCRLLLEQNWKGIFVESDKEKYKLLVENMGLKNPNVRCFNCYVEKEGKNSIDEICARSGFPEINVLSIDVDGLDWEIFSGLKKYIPDICIIEVNARLDPEHAEIIPRAVAAGNIGQSMAVISKTATEIDLHPVCYTGNLFLIKEKYQEILPSRRCRDIYLEFFDTLDDMNKKCHKEFFSKYEFPVPSKWIKDLFTTVK